MNHTINQRSIKRRLVRQGLIEEMESPFLLDQRFLRRHPTFKRLEHFHPTKGWRGGPLRLLWIGGK